MKNLLAIFALALGFGLAVTPAFAQAKKTEKVPPSPYKYCLEENLGGDGGGALPLLCRYITLEQCKASRSSPADRCVPNITGQRS